MSKQKPGRVIVGVHASPAGLGALRAAVAQAELGGRELLAVRAYRPPLTRDPAVPDPVAWRLAHLPDPTPSQIWEQMQAAREEREIRVVRDAFTRALGGIPRGVRVRPVASTGPPGAVLVATAYREDDLLVVGEPSARGLRRGWPWRWFRRSTFRYCLTHATCPVLAVPPLASCPDPAVPPLASCPDPAVPPHDPTRAAGDRPRPSSPDVPTEGADIMPHAPVARVRSVDSDGTTAWPGRSCCCTAPPRVEVLLPTHDGRRVDLFLCGHHYRSSLGPLALADATVRFRESPSALSPAGHR
ncbi:universal stress protein [Streptomyces sp. NPDC050534]|uniref:universal stress protein n=1 Tax=Streptomyces sp. NPDC050534 TaxID=3365625 RepID=UPI0037A3469C